MTTCSLWRSGLVLAACAVVWLYSGCVQDGPDGHDAATDVVLPDVDTEDASVVTDSGVDSGDAGDAGPLCPHILTRRWAPELLAHGPGLYCGANCRQVTFADTMHRYDVWGDYVVYTTSQTATGNNAYLANVVTGEEWRLEEGPWSQPGCSQITIDDGVVSWVYARFPGQGPPLVELVRTYDIGTQGYTDLTCIEYEDLEISVIRGLDSTMSTLAFTMSDQCDGCSDLYTISLVDGLLAKRAGIGQGIVQTRADGDLVLWTDLNAPQSDILSFDLVTEEIRNISNHEADQWKARKNGDRVVWVDHRNDVGGYLNQRNSDIYYHDLTTGQTHEVCIDLALQDEPDMDGDLVVWEDWRNNPNPIPVYSNEFHNSDIYMKDLSTGDTTQLTDFEGMEMYPRVQGNRVYFRMADGNGGSGIFMIELGN